MQKESLVTLSYIVGGLGTLELLVVQLRMQCMILESFSFLLGASRGGGGTIRKSMRKK